MNKLVQKLCREYHLKVEERLAAGNICNAVYKVLDKDGKPLVLKVGTDERTIAEITMNLVGYQKLKDCGLSHFIPTIVTAIVENKWGFILMDYCGPDFVTRSQQASNPLRLYQGLIAGMEVVYHQSLRVSAASQEMVFTVAKKIVEQYECCLMPLDQERMLVSRLEMLLEFAKSLDLRLSCFSSWDFTPEDVYLTPQGVKYGDPHEDVFGIPVIDLACFAGVTRDAYRLPGSIEGYQLLHDFAISTVAQLLEVPSETAEKIFLLGRVLQCFLSARFRMVSEPERAAELFAQGREYLARIAH